MFKWKRAAVIAVAAALALTGCGGGGGGEAEPGPDGESARGGTLTWAATLPVSSFEARAASWGNESPYLQAVYDTILRAAPDGEIEPNLATEWAYNEDKTSLTLTVRDDVEFTDGTKLDAAAVAQNVLEFRDGGSPNASALARVDDARAVDETTLEITLSEPDPALLTYLTQNAGLVQSPATIDSPDAATTPVGSGPYIFNAGETVVGSSYVFDRNEDYWNPDAQHYEKLVIGVYADTTALLNAVQGGQVNAAVVFDPTTVPQMEAAGFTTHILEGGWAGLLLLDREGTISPALQELEVRQAINYAMDREALLETLSAGYGTATAQIFPTSSPSFDAELDSFYERDVEKAKELMAEAGYADGFTVRMPRAAGLPPQNFVLVADQLAQIGITVEYVDVQLNEYIGAILSQEYPMAWMQLQQDPTDWQLAQFQIAAGSTWNAFHVADPTVEDLLETLQVGSEEEAVAAGKELNRYLVENAWFAPFNRTEQPFVTDANTTAEVQVLNAVPYLWNVQPK